MTEFSEVYISLADTDLEKSVLWIPNSKIEPNGRAGYRYQLDQPNGQTAVTLIGRPEELAKITEDDVKLTADMLKYANSERVNVPVQVELPKNIGIVWASLTKKNAPTVDINIIAPAE